MVKAGKENRSSRKVTCHGSLSAAEINKRTSADGQMFDTVPLAVCGAQGWLGMPQESVHWHFKLSILSTSLCQLFLLSSLP